MKVNIEIPDDLYQKVEAKCALEGRSLDEICEDLFRRYANEDAREDHQEGVGLPTELDGKPLPPWFGILNKYSRRVKDREMRAIRQSIAAGRARRYGLRGLSYRTQRKDRSEPA